MSAYEVVGDSRDRLAWLEQRRSGIGASDVPSILGVSPFRSALSVYADKIGLSEDTEETEAMRWGHILEPTIIAEFGKETERKVWRAGQLLRSTEAPFMLATLDGEQSAIERASVGNVEAKATGWRVGDWSEGIPPHVVVQLQAQLMVSGRSWGSVVVLQNGCRLLWADVERDQPFIDEILIPTCAEFWRRVQQREPVAPDGSESSKQALKWLYPDAAPGKFVNLDGSLIDLDRERCELKERIGEMTKRVEVIDQTIKSAIGDAEIGYLADGTVYTHKLQHRKGFTVEPSSFRVLRRSAPKGARQ